MIAPRSTPAAIVARLEREVAAIVAEPDVKTAWNAVGIVPQPGAAAALGERIARDIEKWRRVTAGLKIKSE
jgi:tripartite-type tricarboxylate transporter receptor subunit TctC